MDDRREIGDEVVVEVLVQHRVDRIDRIGHEQRVAVGRRVCGEFAADVVVAAGAIFDDERLAELRRQPLRDQPRGDIGRTSRGGGDDDTDRTNRIGVRARRRRATSQRGCASGKAKKLTARNGQVAPPAVNEMDPADIADLARLCAGRKQAVLLEKLDHVAVEKPRAARSGRRGRRHEEFSSRSPGMRALSAAARWCAPSSLPRQDDRRAGDPRMMILRIGYRRSAWN